MNRYILLLTASVLLTGGAYGQIDMQAHVASDEGIASYADYLARQADYYTGDASYSNLITLSGDDLFGVLNSLMGTTCLNTKANGFDYGDLRTAYGSVDRDLNDDANFIAFYSGTSHSAEWNGGGSWNREHVWPQSKGVSSSFPMGFDMHSVRPSLTKDNSSRGNTAYGESKNYYDPEEDIPSPINPYYKTQNMGSYRGDCARIILYDYIVYGESGGHQNDHYNGAAQLPDNKLGTGGVFESLAILLKWHAQDPPSLTEMVRNDGAQDYEGNRNPFIDYPELAVQMLCNERNVTTYAVTYSDGLQASPRYTLSTPAGFVTYLTNARGQHPEADQLTVTGATAEYNPILGRLILTNVQGGVSIYVMGNGEWTDCEEAKGEGTNDITIYLTTGIPVAQTNKGALNHTLRNLPRGLYVVKSGGEVRKIYR